MKINMKQWILDLLNEKKKKAMPVLTFPVVQKMGIDVEKFISDSDLLAEGMKIISDTTPVCAVLSVMDLSIEAECFGSTIRYSKDEVPTVIGSIVSSEEEADALKIPEVGCGRTKIVIDAVRKASEMITDKPVIAGTIGPFSLAGRLMDVSQAMVYCYDEPDMVHKILEKCTSFIISYIKAFKEAGANGVLIAEPLAGLMSPALADEFSADYVKKIVDECQDDYFMVAYHNCGKSTIQQVESILKTGASLLHFGNAIDMEAMVKLIPENIIVAGNVNPAGQFRNGTPESIKKETLEIMGKCCKYKNFLISSGCDIPPASSWDNINAFFAAVDEFYNK